MQALSFRITSNFAAFNDPTVTTNQLVYYIPSKTAVVGILGAMLGVRRSNTLDTLYGSEYMDLYRQTKIGIKANCRPNKITFFTNHRSLKERKTKPVKKELLENPDYTIYVATQRHDELMRAIKDNTFAFPPYLGHTYCPAKITDAKQYDIAEARKPHTTSAVILDESEPYHRNFEFECDPQDDGDVIVERHLHMFYANDKQSRLVLKHWIPIGTKCKITESNRSISGFYNFDGEMVCLY